MKHALIAAVDLGADGVRRRAGAATLVQLADRAANVGWRGHVAHEPAGTAARPEAFAAGPGFP